MCQDRAGWRHRYRRVVAACGPVRNLGIPDADDAIQTSGGRERPCRRRPGGRGLEVGADGGQGGEIVAGEGEFGQHEEVEILQARGGSGEQSVGA